jgi:signal transduction histidine kinase
MAAVRADFKTRFRKTTLAFFFLWNPLLSLVLTVISGDTDQLFFSWTSAMLIGNTVTLTCSLGFLAIRATERVLLRRVGGIESAHGRAWTLAVVAVLMPIGLSLGFQVLHGYYLLTRRPWTPPALHSYISGLFWGAIIFGLFTLWETWRASALRVKTLEADRLQATLAALTSQINPHLLFNALNTIASLIPSNPDAAEEVTLRLSELYRGILDSSRSTTHSLADELGVCRAYLDVERARFGSRLAASVSLDGVDAGAVALPALLLQPLVENAIKYGIAPRGGGGSVAIRAARDGAHVVISIEDDGAGFGKAPVRGGAGTGVTNARARVELQYGGRGFFDITERPGGGTRVRIGVPVSS